jgi:hypothetical protein
MAARLGRALPLRILPTLHRPDAKLASDLHAAIQRRHGAATLPVSIREHESLREAAGFGQPITEYAPASEACQDFVQLVAWLEANPVANTRGATAASLAVAPVEQPVPEATSPRMADLLARMRAHAGFSAEPAVTTETTQQPAAEPAPAEGSA